MSSRRAGRPTARLGGRERAGQHAAGGDGRAARVSPAARRLGSCPALARAGASGLPIGAELQHGAASGAVMTPVRTHSSAGFGARVLSATPARSLRPPPQMTLRALLLPPGSPTVRTRRPRRSGLGHRPRPGEPTPPASAAVGSGQSPGTGQRGPTLSVDGEHQGPVAGVELQQHGRLDQVLGQVAQEGDRPARQVRTVSALPPARGHVPEGSLPTGPRATAGTPTRGEGTAATFPTDPSVGIRPTERRSALSWWTD